MCTKEKEVIVTERCDGIIFLDFDGCCTSIESGTHMILLDDLAYKPCKKIVTKLINFCKSENLRVVITSNWRKYEEIGYFHYRGIKFKCQLKKLRKMLGDVYLDTLPIMSGKKSIATVKWLDDHPDYTDSYVIFDDVDYEGFTDESKYDMKDRFVMIDGQVGITDCDLLDALKKI